MEDVNLATELSSFLWELFSPFWGIILWVFWIVGIALVITAIIVTVRAYRDVHRSNEPEVTDESTSNDEESGAEFLDDQFEKSESST